MLRPATRTVIFGKPGISRLWQNGRRAAWFDPRDPSNLMQSDTGTTAVTTTSDVVGWMRDITGQGNTATQATALNKPTFKLSSGLCSVVFDGTNSFIQKTGHDNSGSQYATFVVGIRQTALGTTAGVLTEIGVPTVAAGGLGIYINNSSPSGAFGGGVGRASNFRFNNGTGSPVASTFVASVQIDPSATTLNDQIKVRINGQEVTGIVAGSAGTLSLTNAFASGRTISIGQREGGTLRAGFEFFGGGVVYDRLSPSELALAEAWCAERCGVTLINQEVAGSSFTWAETGTTSQSTNYTVTSPFAKVEFDTTATSVAVTAYSDAASTFPTLSEVAVDVDGVHHQFIRIAADGSHTGVVQLPVGTKRIALVNGPQSTPVASPLIGSFITRVKANAGLAPVTPNPTNRLLIYGDSISVGAFAANPTSFGWAMVVRAAYYPKSLAMEAWGFRSLWDDCSDSTKRAAFVAKIVAYNPSKIRMAIGTNDYGLNKWTAAAFQTAYGALLDDIHTALPAVTIDCETLGIRTDEAVANTAGNTPPQYRTAISNAVSTRTSFCTLRDGTTYYTSGQLSDSVHPGDAGHAAKGAAIRTEMGI